jgi:hypothetical protein
MKVEGLGPTDVFNIRDDASPGKIGSFVYPANEWSDREVQDALRCAFTQWGSCDRLQTDKETRLEAFGKVFQLQHLTEGLPESPCLLNSHRPL